MEKVDLDEIFDIPSEDGEKEDYRNLLQNIQTLKDNERITIELRYFEDLKFEDIALSLGISENNAVSDAVRSYTRSQIFATMTSSMLSPTQQKNALLPLLPPIVPLSAWTILASAYGI